jgi:nitroreductase
MTARFDLGQTDRLLTTTRSVRRRLDLTRPVERDLVLECLRIALQAPSGGNSQPWRWLIVDDPAVRARLAELYRRSHDPYLAASRAAAQQAAAPAWTGSSTRRSTCPTTCTRCRCW